ncbi:hypothetical protein ACVQKW_14995 [Edwardsiella tarda]|uniref:Uncharacterized protein n=3 Tax=Edwardsiella tarda TaxID=636 RepID=A0A2A7U3Y2_EDWTA|nr:hypothetical protein [Edwardsiella tarda]AKH89486.1 hypothetical protein AAW15_10225 [Edwardsiella tarda]ATI63118.1 hypothetical protein CPU03_01915 [Edwardsiella tarda]EFE23514.1 hypothetical protein EDWATA_01461 [Edwardsiella tarda ATCC 23685]PEH73116.1 hypothetical protein CRM76_14835 [Edwardsiella tarda]UAL57844.1 hypothetical protein K8O98_08125 [Edwardsiella tarda]
MKQLKAIIAVCTLFCVPAFAATQINSMDTAGYTKVASLSLQQAGLPTVGDSKAVQAIDKQCHKLGIQPDQCYFRVLSILGDSSDHKTAFVEIYKK